jgi:hypothetical protein
MTGRPGWNMRESGLGVDCVCMNILRRCPASHFNHSEFCFSQHLHIQKFKAQEKKIRSRKICCPVCKPCSIKSRFFHNILNIKKFKDEDKVYVKNSLNMTPFARPNSLQSRVFHNILENSDSLRNMLENSETLSQLLRNSNSLHNILENPEFLTIC